MEYEGDGDTNCNWLTWYTHKKIDNGTGGLGNKRTNGDHTDDSIIKIGKNTEKIHRYLSRHAATPTPVANHLLTHFK